MRGIEQLSASVTPPGTVRLAGVHRFQLGKRAVLTEPGDTMPSPVRSLVFTFPDEEATSRWPTLVAEILLSDPAPQARNRAELLLTLLDKSGRPMQVHRAPLAALLNADRGLADQPTHVLLGLQATVTSMPMGSTWGTFIHQGPWFSYEQLLAAEDARVWLGVRSLYADVAQGGA